MTPRSGPTPPYLIRPTLETLLEDHDIQYVLCDELEAVADRLPALPTPPEIRRLCERILHIANTHFQRAEEVLSQMPPDRRPMPRDFALLHQMHQLDELHAHDLVAELWRYVASRDRSNVGQLAYMLRCYFDGCRRAIALKESWISDSSCTPTISD